mgnify:CR=1 FL=1
MWNLKFHSRNAQNIGNFLDKDIENKYKYGCRYFGKEKTSYIIK